MALGHFFFDGVPEGKLDGSVKDVAVTFHTETVSIRIRFHRGVRPGTRYQVRVTGRSRLRLRNSPELNLLLVRGMFGVAICTRPDLIFLRVPGHRFGLFSPLRRYSTTQITFLFLLSYVATIINIQATVCALPPFTVHFNQIDFVIAQSVPFTPEHYNFQ